MKVNSIILATIILFLQEEVPWRTKIILFLKSSLNFPQSLHLFAKSTPSLLKIFPTFPKTPTFSQKIPPHYLKFHLKFSQTYLNLPNPLIFSPKIYYLFLKIPSSFLTIFKTFLKAPTFFQKIPTQFLQFPLKPHPQIFTKHHKKSRNLKHFVTFQKYLIKLHILKLNLGYSLINSPF